MRPYQMRASAIKLDSVLYFPIRGLAFAPSAVGVEGRGQRWEYERVADLRGQPERAELSEQVLLDPGQGEDDAAPGEFGPDRLHRLKGGEVHLDVGLHVEYEPLQRRIGLGGGNRPFPEVLGVGEEQRRVVTVDDQAGVVRAVG